MSRAGRNDPCPCTWFLFDLDIEDDRTVLDLFLDREGARLPAAERDFLERILRTNLALYEVDAVEPERGLTLLDLWTGERVSVWERMATRQLVRWDLLARGRPPEARAAEACGPAQENGERRGARRPRGRPAYDFAWVWRELGLERP